ncbi:hypothetical protein ACFVP3_38705 [Streptomyces sp. NPDC057806]|uniref:hypothetical protein n=1 Tax=Streptomyces sp. NPDC057806 TaxID=3346255 RepID=UPI003694324A
MTSVWSSGSWAMASIEAGLDVDAGQALDQVAGLGLVGGGEGCGAQVVVAGGPSGGAGEDGGAQHLSGVTGHVRAGGCFVPGQPEDVEDLSDRVPGAGQGLEEGLGVGGVGLGHCLVERHVGNGPRVAAGGLDGLDAIVAPKVNTTVDAARDLRNAMNAEKSVGPEFWTEAYKLIDTMEEGLAVGEDQGAPAGAATLPEATNRDDIFGSAHDLADWLDAHPIK